MRGETAALPAAADHTPNRMHRLASPPSCASAAAPRQLPPSSQPDTGARAPGSLRRRAALGGCVLAAALAGGAQAASPAPVTAAPPDVKSCLGITAAEERLACYDKYAGFDAMLSLPASPVLKPEEAAQAASPAAPAATTVRTPDAPPPTDSAMSRYWELDEADKRGTFNYTGYRPNFFLPLHVVRKVNRTPNSPTRATPDDVPDYMNGETKIQLSLRSKIAQDLFLPGADLWVAYTQQSMWQLWNRDDSAPFRNTDYQPEVIYVVPTPRSLQALPFGFSWRMTQLGFVHQSNGQPGELSRSWNRLYGAVGIERGDFGLTWRLERRVEPDRDDDDNPDILRFLNASQIEATWTPGRATAQLTWRPSLGGDGSVQLDWSYPVFKERPDGLRWYAQLFYGYGETLLDYNFRHTSIGVGLSIFKF